MKPALVMIERDVLLGLCGGSKVMVDRLVVEGHQCPSVKPERRHSGDESFAAVMAIAMRLRGASRWKSPMTSASVVAAAFLDATDVPARERTPIQHQVVEAIEPVLSPRTDPTSLMGVATCLGRYLAARVGREIDGWRIGPGVRVPGGRTEYPVIDRPAMPT